jgi:hypothetical protein
VDGDVLLLDEQLDEQPLEAGVDVPVERAQVVAQGVVAVVGELDRLAALDAAPDALHAAADGPRVTSSSRSSWRRNALVEDGRVDGRRQQVGPRGPPLVGRTATPASSPAGQSTDGRGHLRRGLRARRRRW